jgi:hypothetical protein
MRGRIGIHPVALAPTNGRGFLFATTCRPGCHRPGLFHCRYGGPNQQRGAVSARAACRQVGDQIPADTKSTKRTRRSFHKQCVPLTQRGFRGSGADSRPSISSQAQSCPSFPFGTCRAYLARDSAYGRMGRTTGIGRQKKPRILIRFAKLILASLLPAVMTLKGCVRPNKPDGRVSARLVAKVHRKRS